MNETASPLTVALNGVPVEYGSLPPLDLDRLRSAILGEVGRGLRVASLFALSSESLEGVELLAVLADDESGNLRLGRAVVEGDSYPSLTPDCPQAHLFEREIAEQFGLRPEGHSWFKPVRFARSMRAGHDAWNRSASEPVVAGDTQFYRVHGDEIHEVAVGPVHAGVIEPGHFRFQCHGEQVFHLEIALGYQHRGVEEALLGGPHRATVHQFETVAGDATIAHTWAYHQNLEALSETRVGARAHVLRAIALELERLANHTGDLGALAGDVGFQPTMAFCGRLRGDFLNMTAALCGSRFGRGLIRPGGTRFDLGAREIDELLGRLLRIEAEVTDAVELLWNTPSVQARFEGTGIVSRAQCIQLGLVGPVARACGIERDARTTHPIGMYQFVNIPLSTAHHGDVNSRAFVRWLEIRRSLQFVKQRLQKMPEPGETRPKMSALKPDCLVVSLVEGWRGEVCHTAVTDARGKFRRYKIVDPSFHNWAGLAMALRNQQISDFPLCNKSFNLSYCGHDL